MMTEKVMDLSEDEMWQAVLGREKGFEGRFWLGVVTTGIYCRPGCPARTPKRENVRFFETIEAAQAAGLRACKRCKPDDASLDDQQGRIIADVVRQLQQAEEPPVLEELARVVGLSPWYLHRLFKTHTGLTPKQFTAALRSGKMQKALDDGLSVTEAIYAAGYGAPSRMYEEAVPRMGMKPATRRNKGAGMILRYGITDCWLGRVLVAATEKGVCCIQLGHDDAALIEELQQRFARAQLEEAEPGSDYAAWIAQVVTAIDTPAAARKLPLDIQGTAFQEQVWQALRDIPAGETVTYSGLAEKIGKPKAVRAVASACGANKLAVVIPCHRVIGKDGSLTGYRWGKDIKARLLEKEAS
jgi:AraC family transcriptional regulator of adaptative response/methylated-DNA-[protein]-cysteine methyltransferase